MRERKKEENVLFLIGWFLVGVTILIYIAYHIFSIPPLKMNGPCVLHTLFNLYCPGCGGTRAISALLHGQFIDSFICHPLVPYTAIIGGWFLISQLIERISKHRIKIGLRYRDIYLWIALGIVVMNFIVKNALLLIWHVDLLASYIM